MIRLMIVDDEKRTREGLANFIPWKEIGIDEVVTSEDGTYAYELCKASPFHILLTDVRMPKMDGVRLAELVKAIYPDIVIIFLSGFSDKEYLMSAINLNALSYIEKPIDMEEVKTVVSRAIAKIKASVREKNEHENMKSALSVTLPVLMQQTVLSLINSEDSESFPEKNIGLLNLESHTYQPFSALLIRLFRRPDLSESEREQSNLKILDYMFAHSKTFRCKYLSGFTNPEHLVLLIQASLSPSSADSGYLMDELTSAVKYADAGITGIAAGVGTASGNLKSVRHSYEQALTALRKSFFTGMGSYNYCSSNKNIFTMEDAALEAFDKIVVTKSMAMLNEYISSLIRRIRRFPDTDPDYVRSLFIKLLDRFNFNLGETSKNNLDENASGIGLWKIISKFDTISEMEAFFNSQVIQHYKIYEDGVLIQGKVTEIKKYIQRNYPDNGLSIKQIAKNVYLSHTYACYIFKKTTGKTINEYITEVRISEAKELLKNKHVKMYEVSEKIGFTNQNYFAKIFKNAVGYTPSEYRERYL